MKIFFLKFFCIFSLIICLSTSLFMPAYATNETNEDEYVVYVPTEKKVVLVANVDENYPAEHFDAVIKNEKGEAVEYLRFAYLEGYKKIVELEPGTYEFSGINLVDPNNFPVETITFEVKNRNKHIEILVGKPEETTEEVTEPNIDVVEKETVPEETTEEMTEESSGLVSIIEDKNEEIGNAFNNISSFFGVLAIGMLILIVIAGIIIFLYIKKKNNNI